MLWTINFTSPVICLWLECEFLIKLFNFMILLCSYTLRVRLVRITFRKKLEIEIEFDFEMISLEILNVIGWYICWCNWNVKHVKDIITLNVFQEICWAHVCNWRKWWMGKYVLTLFNILCFSYLLHQSWLLWGLLWAEVFGA